VVTRMANAESVFGGDSFRGVAAVAFIDKLSSTITPTTSAQSFVEGREASGDKWFMTC
jgi:hypothetical protein